MHCKRYRALTVEDFEEVMPVIGCVLPDWKDSSLPEHTRAQVSKHEGTGEPSIHRGLCVMRLREIACDRRPPVR